MLKGCLREKDALSDKLAMGVSGSIDRSVDPEAVYSRGYIPNGEKNVEQAYAELRDEYKVRTALFVLSSLSDGVLFLIVV